MSHRPKLVTDIFDELKKAFPSLSSKPMPSGTLPVTLISNEAYEVDYSEIYHFLLHSRAGLSSPDIDIVIFERPYTEYYHRDENDPDDLKKKIELFDLANYPKTVTGSEQRKEEKLQSLGYGCVIAVQSRNGFFPFNHLYVFDGVRYKSLTSSFFSAATAGIAKFDNLCPKRVAKALGDCIQKYIDLEASFTARHKNAQTILNEAKDVLQKKRNFDVTRSHFNGRDTLDIEIEVKKSLLGQIKDKFGKASLGGTYTLKATLLPENYWFHLARGDLQKSDILNYKDITDLHSQLKDDSALMGEAAIDFFDAVKAAPLVKISSQNSTGHGFSYYVVLPDHAKMAKPDKLFEQALEQTMNHVGPVNKP